MLDIRTIPREIKIQCPDRLDGLNYLMGYTSTYAIRHYPRRMEGLRRIIESPRRIMRETEHLAVTHKDPKSSTLYALAKAILHRKRLHTFVAKDGGNIVGYISVISGKFLKVRGPHISSWGFSPPTAVAASVRSYSPVPNDSRARGGVHRMELEVFENNTNAVRLYEKLGFVAEGRRREAIQTPEGYEDVI